MITLILIFSTFLSFGYGDFNCPPGYDCSTMCANNTNSPIVDIPCADGYYCPENALPKRCPEGSYCPTPSEIYGCPEGYWCPIGTYEPRKCQAMAYCKANSKRYFYWGFFIWMIISLAYVSTLFLVYYYRDAIKKFLTNPSKVTVIMVSQDVEMKDKTASSTITAKKEFIDFHFKNIEVEVPLGNIFTRLCSKKKKVLKGVSGQIIHGKITAIMGPSGSGKSTLFSVLLGRTAISGGEILVNGKKTNLRKFVSNIGFVPQDDVMIREVSVRTNIETSAYTRLPTSWSRKQKQDLVEQVIDILGLRHIENSVIGDENTRGISGGERKRVNIAMELVSSPLALFLDEPTSGLDSCSARDVLVYLKKIAKDLNITVCAVIHQPAYDIFLAFDEVLLLGKGGREVYRGFPAHAYEHFEKMGYKPSSIRTNPADFYLDIITANEPTKNSLQLEEEWQNTGPEDTLEKAKENIVEEPPTSSPPNPFVQWWYFYKRNQVKQLSNFKGRLLAIFIHMVTGFIVGLSFFAEPIFVAPPPARYIPVCPNFAKTLYCEDAERDFLQLLGTFILMGLGSVVTTFAVASFFDERLVHLREARTGTSNISYFFAKDLVDIESFIINSFVFTGALFLVSSPRANFFDIVISIILYEYVVYGFSYASSWLVPIPRLLALIAALTGGIGTERDGANIIYWGPYFTESLYISNLVPESLNAEELAATEKWIAKSTFFQLDKRNSDFAALFCIGLFLRILAFVVMKLRSR